MLVMQQDATQPTLEVTCACGGLMKRRAPAEAHVNSTNRPRQYATPTHIQNLDVWKSNVDIALYRAQHSTAVIASEFSSHVRSCSSKWTLQDWVMTFKATSGGSDQQVLQG